MVHPNRLMFIGLRDGSIAVSVHVIWTLRTTGLIMMAFVLTALIEQESNMTRTEAMKSYSVEDKEALRVLAAECGVTLGDMIMAIEPDLVTPEELTDS